MPTDKCGEKKKKEKRTEHWSLSVTTACPMLALYGLPSEMLSDSLLCALWRFGKWF